MLRGTHSLDKRGLKSKKRLSKRLATAVLRLLQLVPHISETFLSDLQRCLPWGADDLLIWRGAAWLSLKARGTVQGGYLSGSLQAPPLVLIIATLPH